MLGALMAVAGIAALAGHATAGEMKSSERLESYRAHAGEPVESFRYFGSFNGWAELGDSALAVWTKPTEAWLLTLDSPCRDLSKALAISISNNTGHVGMRFGHVAAGSDQVSVEGSGTSMAIPCRIQSIQPLDLRALNASRRKLREVRTEGRQAVLAAVANDPSAAL
ncbi:hypothetical protein B1L07_07385 [Stenotrophomonas acidaminiphila]|nr:hypothetical protein B1L07_07385 [Stenotrophomonas acidaminiphila]